LETPRYAASGYRPKHRPILNFFLLFCPSAKIEGKVAAGDARYILELGFDIFSTNFQNRYQWPLPNGKRAELC